MLITEKITATTRFDYKAHWIWHSLCESLPSKTHNQHCYTYDPIWSQSHPSLYRRVHSELLTLLRDHTLLLVSSNARAEREVAPYYNCSVATTSSLRLLLSAPAPCVHSKHYGCRVLQLQSLFVSHLLFSNSSISSIQIILKSKVGLETWTATHNGSGEREWRDGLVTYKAIQQSDCLPILHQTR